MIRLGAVVIVLGALASAWATARGAMIENALAFLLLGCGFGLAHAFIARRTIAGAPAEEQGMASSAVPTSLLIGGAVGSAGAGALANVLGFGHGVDPVLAQTNGLLLFGAFTPLALVGLWAAWKLSRA
jgi:hypothetical protein